MDNEFCDWKVRTRFLQHSAKASRFMKIMRKVNAYTAFEFLAPDCKTTLLGKM